MSSPTRYKKGDWKAVCDACGQRYLMSQLRKRWDGLMVCNKDYEPRQPQDFVRAKVDIQAVPVARPESTTYDYVAVSYNRTIDPDALSFRETVSKVVGKIFTETLTLSESVVSIMGFIRTNNEALSLAEVVTKSLSTPGIRALNLYAINSQSLG